MKKQFKGPLTLNVAAREVVLQGVELAADQVMLAYNATVGHVYHNFYADDPAQIIVSGGNTTIRFAPFKDCATHRDSDEVAVFYDDRVHLSELIKTESDQTQTLIQKEFDFIRDRQLTSVYVPPGPWNPTGAVGFQYEVKAESDETQTLIQNEFNETQAGIPTFRTEVKAESDETQAFLNQRLLTPVAGKVNVASSRAFGVETGYSQAVENKPFFGPSKITQTRSGGSSLTTEIEYDNYGNVVSVIPI